MTREWKARTGLPVSGLHGVEEIVAVVFRARGIPDQVGWFAVRASHSSGETVDAPFHDASVASVAGVEEGKRPRARAREPASIGAWGRR